MSEYENNLGKNNNNKGLLFSVVGVLTLIVAIVGATYAYFQATASNANTISGSAATSGLTLTITEEIVPTGDLIPQLGSAINSAAAANCVDGSSNAICQVYSITVNNTGSSAVKVNGTITFDGISSMGNLKWATSASKTSGYSTTGTTASTSSAVLESNISIAASSSSSKLYLIVWINETGSAQSDSGTFTATVTYNSSNGTGVTSTITS